MLRIEMSFRYKKKTTQVIYSYRLCDPSKYSGGNKRLTFVNNLLALTKQMP